MIAGQYQYAGPLATEMLPRLKAAEGVTSMMVKPFGFPLMFMNTREGLLANEKMRLAVQAALGEDDMMLAAFGDPSFYDIEGSIYAPGSFYYDKASTEGYYNQNDPKKAAELAKAAGYNGEPIRILSSQHHDFLYKMSLVVQAQLEQAGFKVDMQIVDWATVMHKRTDASLWDIFFTYHTFVAEPSLLTFTNPSYPGWWNTPGEEGGPLRVQFRTRSGQAQGAVDQDPGPVLQPGSGRQAGGLLYARRQVEPPGGLVAASLAVLLERRHQVRACAPLRHRESSSPRHRGGEVPGRQGRPADDGSGRSKLCWHAPTDQDGAGFSVRPPVEQMAAAPSPRGKRAGRKHLRVGGSTCLPISCDGLPAW